MSKKLILFTSLRDHSEWEKWKTLLRDNRFNPIIDEDKFKITTNADNADNADAIELIVISGNKNLGYFFEVGGEVNLEKFEEFLIKLLNQINELSLNSETVVGIHFGGGRTYNDAVIQTIEIHRLNENINAKYLLDNFNKYGQPILTYYSASGFYDSFINGKLSDLRNFYEELKKNVPDYMPLLKHRIVDLFLPLEIDLQGISECLYRVESEESENEKSAINYLQEVFGDEKKVSNGKGCSYNRQRLSDLQFILIGTDKSQNQELNLECNEKSKKYSGSLVETSLSSAALPGGYGVLQLIIDKKDDNVRRLWQTLLTLCGFQVQEDQDKIFSQDKLISDNNSPIFRYMCLLDCKTAKWKNGASDISIYKMVDLSDINEILNFRDIDIMLKDLTADYHVSIDSDISFHNWFIFLNFCLDELHQQCKK
jgi:hypothetical protein